MSEATTCDHCGKLVRHDDTGKACCEFITYYRGKDDFAVFFDLCKPCKKKLVRKLKKFVLADLRVR